MCDPISMAVVTAGTSAASSIFGFLGQNQAAAANERAANLGYAAARNQAGDEAHQIDQQQSENTVSAIIERTAAQGAISASASSLGTGGSTAAAEENAAAFGAGRKLSIENLNSASQRLQVQNQLNSADLQRRSQIASVQKGNPLSLVLGIAKAGLSGANTFASVGGRFGGSGGGGSGGAAASGATGGVDMSQFADILG